MDNYQGIIPAYCQNPRHNNPLKIKQFLGKIKTTRNRPDTDTLISLIKSKNAVSIIELFLFVSNNLSHFLQSLTQNLALLLTKQPEYPYDDLKLALQNVAKFAPSANDTTVVITAKNPLLAAHDLIINKPPFAWFETSPQTQIIPQSLKELIIEAYAKVGYATQTAKVADHSLSDKDLNALLQLKFDLSKKQFIKHDERTNMPIGNWLIALPLSSSVPWIASLIQLTEKSMSSTDQVGMEATSPHFQI